MPFLMQIATNNKLDNGLYIEDLDLLIPWNTSLRDISKFGHPQIVRHSEQRTDAIWKDVQIFGVRQLDLTAMFWRTLLFGRRLRHVYTYLSSLDTVEQLKSHLDNYFEVTHKKKTFNAFEFCYKWTVDKCKVKVGQGHRFGAYYYLSIDR
jgi:hypothetical protein